MYRLIYKSRNSMDADKESFRDILYSSANKNAGNEITGGLIATKTHYLQLLEGEFEEVNSTFLRIVRDPRHEKVDLIVFRPVEERLFQGWGMRGFGIFHMNPELEKSLKEKYGEEDGGIRLPIEEESSLSFFQDVEMIKS